MRGVKDFIQENLQAMVDYILVISTSAPAVPYPHRSPDLSHQRLQVVNSLRQRCWHVDAKSGSHPSLSS